MSLTQERIMDLGVEVAEEMRDEDGDSYAIDEAWFADYCTRFLFRIREEQEAVGRFIEYPNGWREVSKNNEFYELAEPLFTIPPATPDCNELVEALEKIADTAPGEGSHQLIALRALSKHKASMGEKK